MGSHCGASLSDERPEAKQVLRRSQDVLAPGAGRPEFRDGGLESDDVLVVLQVFVRLKLTINMILDGFLLPTSVGRAERCLRLGVQGWSMSVWLFSSGAAAS